MEIPGPPICRPKRSSRTSAGRRTSATPRKRRPASYWTAWAASTRLLSCAASKDIAEDLYYSWSKEFLEAGKRRLAGDTARAATSSEVKDLKHQAQELKEVVAEQVLELSLLKKA